MINGASALGGKRTLKSLFTDGRPFLLGRMMAAESERQSSTELCTVVAMDPTSISYRVCAVCEKTLSENSNACKFCDFRGFNPGTFGSKRLYRVLLSIATDTKVMVVVCFDRAARVIFGCSADDFFNFSKTNPFAAEKASQILIGEMFRMTLNKPKSGHAQHLRVASVVPLSSNFRPLIGTLEIVYKVDPSQSNHNASSDSIRRFGFPMQRPDNVINEYSVLAS